MNKRLQIPQFKHSFVVTNAIDSNNIKFFHIIAL